MVPLLARHERKGEPWGRGLKALFLLLVFCLFPLAYSHPANVPSANWKVAADGTFTGRVRFDVVAFATGETPKDADDRAMNALLDGPDSALSAALADAAGRFRHGFAALPGGEVTSLAFPTARAVRRFLAGNPVPRLPVMLTATVTGRLAPGARTVAFRYPQQFDTIIQTVEFPYREPDSEPVDPGATSSALAIPTPEEIARTAEAFAAPREGARAEGGGARTKASVVAKPPKPVTTAVPSVAKAVEVPKGVNRDALPPVAPPSAKGVEAPKGTGQIALPGGKGPAGAVLSSGKPSVAQKKPSVANAHPLPPPEEGISSPVAPSVEGPPALSDVPTPNPLGMKVATYGRMGFTHILPQGLDHILFVLGLFLLGSNTKALVKQITAFTVAHSITLALTALGVIHLPGRIIEPIIAISIAFVAIENLFARDVRPWRTAVVFLFGLVHGMGFAEVFADAGLRGAGLLTALVSFNVGVELGQLAVVGLAFAAVGWFRKDARYRQIVVMPASLLIALVAIFWTVQRAFGLGV